jgi:ankyrin repeat protein
VISHVRRIALTGLFAVGLHAARSNAPLADAAEEMDKAALRTLVAQHADVNAAQVDGMTALHWAAFRDDIEAAKLLVAAGANVKAANRYGVTPLSLACTNGDGTIVELLLKAGADPNTTLPGGETVLMTAARTGRVEAVKSLIAHDALVNTREPRSGQTALMWAAAEGNVDAIEALLKAGANLHERLDSGYTPFLFAVREGRLPAVRAMVAAGADVNEIVEPHKATSPSRPASGAGWPKAGMSALVLATANAHFELAAWLLDHGADPNAAGAGYTALHTIASLRRPGLGDNDPAPQGSGNMTSLEYVKKLVEKGADVNAKMTKNVKFGLAGINQVGSTPFFQAARTADAELMRLLAKLGADPKLNNADDSTPLMVAAGLGTRSPGEDAGTEDEVIEALQAALDLGLDINAVDKNGETAMHGAAYKNSPKAVEFLAAHGAKMEIWNQKNKQGWTPLTIAEGHRFGNFKPSLVTVEALHKVMGDKPKP